MSSQTSLPGLSRLAIVMETCGATALVPDGVSSWAKLTTALHGMLATAVEFSDAGACCCAEAF